MKKILAALLALISMMTASAFAEDKLSIVCTTFPQYDWVRQILGAHADDVELTLLLDNGIDLHNYQPTAADIAKISSSDLFIYVGGESDGWVDDVLEAAQNPNLKAISMLASVEAKEEEVVEGMQETEHDHDHSKEVSTFEDDQVQDRALLDWAGDWQSAYPFALDGTLDEAFAAMAESGKMTADEYKAYYQTGYKSDIQDIKINGDHIAFTYDDGKTVESDYRYVGYYIQNWSTGTKAAMYRFEAVDQGSGAPVYIEFNDHMIESAAVEHFHLRMSDESFDAIVDPEKSWPTFFPADMTGEEIGFAFDKLLNAGAADVYTVPTGMKKNRPGIMLCVLCNAEKRSEIIRILFKHTSTLGVRECRMPRYILQRETQTAKFEDGTIRLKTAQGFGVKRAKFEYADIAALAERRAITLADAKKIAETAFKEFSE